MDCFFVGRLAGTKGSVWQLSAIGVASSYAWTELVSCPRATRPGCRPRSSPTGLPTSKLARRVAAELRAAGWRLERALTTTAASFARTTSALVRLASRHTLTRAGRPQTNGAVEALHRLILEECWRPAFARYPHVRVTGRRRGLAHYLDDYNLHRVHNGRLTGGRILAEIVYRANRAKTTRAVTVGTSR
jgi:hypothetical protein